MLMIATLDGDLARGRRPLNGVYPPYLDRAHRRVGPWFQSRLTGMLVAKEAYLWELARYSVRHPGRVGVVGAVSEWPWRS